MKKDNIINRLIKACYLTLRDFQPIMITALLIKFTVTSALLKVLLIIICGLSMLWIISGAKNEMSKV